MFYCTYSKRYSLLSLSLFYLKQSGTKSGRAQWGNILHEVALTIYKILIILEFISWNCWQTSQLKLRFQNDFDPPLWLRKAEENVLKDPEFMAILLSRHFSSHLGCAKLFHSNYHGSRRIISCLGTVMLWRWGRWWWGASS